MLTFIPHRYFDPKAAFRELTNAKRSRLMSLVASPVGLVTIAGAFLIDLPPVGIAMMLFCGLLTDLTCFFAYQVSSYQIRVLTANWSQALRTARHIVKIPYDAEKLRLINQWSDMIEVQISASYVYSYGSEYGNYDDNYVLLSFDSEENKLLFRMKWL